MQLKIFWCFNLKKLGIFLKKNLIGGGGGGGS